MNHTEAKQLRLSLKTKWFEMTKSGVKTEDYREITPYWINRLVANDFSFDCHDLGIVDMAKINLHSLACPNGFFKKFDINTMTLGYPPKGDLARMLNFEHDGIEIRTGNPVWGAEPGEIYFVIKHGSIIV